MPRRIANDKAEQPHSSRDDTHTQIRRAPIHTPDSSRNDTHTIRRAQSETPPLSHSSREKRAVAGSRRMLAWCIRRKTRATNPGATAESRERNVRWIRRKSFVDYFLRLFPTSTFGRSL